MLSRKGRRHNAAPLNKTKASKHNIKIKMRAKFAELPDDRALAAAAAKSCASQQPWQEVTVFDARTSSEVEDWIGEGTPPGLPCSMNETPCAYNAYNQCSKGVVLKTAKS